MSFDPRIPADDGGDDALAAEYVLGVLDQDERLRAATRIGRDPAFARLVERWEVEFGGLNGQFAEVTPPRALKAKVNALIFAEPERAPLLGSAMWSALPSGARSRRRPSRAWRARLLRHHLADPSLPGRARSWWR